MNTLRKVLVGLWLLVLTLIVGGTAPTSADSPFPENQVPGRVESTARRLANGLRQQGYEVARGYFKLYTQDDCQYTYVVIANRSSAVWNQVRYPAPKPATPPMWAWA